MDKICQLEEGAHRIVQEFYQAFPTDRLLKHLKPVSTIFDPKIEDESAATSPHESTDVDLGNLKNEYFKKMKMKLSRSCADLSTR